MKKLTYFAMILLMIACNNQKPVLTLPALFSGNMVMQQNAQANIWGWSEPGTKINIETSWGEVASAITDSNGKWMTSLETPSFGGPFTITVKAAKTEITINNVMIGEVWLCSGQSNMEMPLKGWPPRDTIEGSAFEIANAGNSNLRMFTVAHNVAVSPLNDCVGSWEISSPKTAGNFSATAYFFGKKIANELGIPVGLIHSSWGGTPAEAWASAEYIDDIEGFENYKAKLEKALIDYKKYEAFLSQMKSIPIESLPADHPYENIDLNDSAFVSAELDISSWGELQVPSLWESTQLPSFDGIVWLQKDFTYDGKMYPEGFELYLGPVDDMDATYLNGVKLGSNEIAGVYQKERIYTIPANLLKEGMNRIAVKVTDTGGGGGIYGMKAPSINKGTIVVVNLAGNWKFKPIATFYDNKIVVYGEDGLDYNATPKMEMQFNQYSPTVLFNGMINPLVPYTFQGAIWYQGESNVGRGKQYEKLFPAMITNWREVWGQGSFPFYYVQISPYNYGENANETTAELRDAQFKTLSLENTGMVVTMDIGNPVNIHPANKKDVGERLALWALAKTYQKEGFAFSGPLYKNAVFNKNKVEIEFDYANNGLVLSDQKTYFEIAGDDGIFYPATSEIAGSKIVVQSAKVKAAKQVRYAWTDDCVPNLFNVEGLPASPFKAVGQ